MDGSSRPPGSVLRIRGLATNVLSTVSWQAQSLRPCFRPHRSWDSSLQGLPLTEDRLRLSTQPGFLVVILRCAETHDSSPCRRRFPRRPRFHAVAWFPRRLWAPFSRAEARFPVTLGLAPWNRLVPPASPTSKLRSLLRVRSRLGRVSPLQPADTLLGFCPSRALSFHASDSRPARARARALAFARRLRLATQRTAAPCAG